MCVCLCAICGDEMGKRGERVSWREFIFIMISFAPPEETFLPRREEGGERRSAMNLSSGASGAILHLLEAFPTSVKSTMDVLGGLAPLRAVIYAIRPTMVASKKLFSSEVLLAA